MYIKNVSVVQIKHYLRQTSVALLALAGIRTNIGDIDVPFMFISACIKFLIANCMQMLHQYFVDENISLMMFPCQRNLDVFCSRALATSKPNEMYLESMILVNRFLASC